MLETSIMRGQKEAFLSAQKEPSSIAGGGIVMTAINHLTQRWRENIYRGIHGSCRLKSDPTRLDPTRLDPTRAFGGRAALENARQRVDSFLFEIVSCYVWPGTRVPESRYTTAVCAVRAGGPSS